MGNAEQEESFGDVFVALENPGEIPVEVITVAIGSDEEPTPEITQAFLRKDPGLLRRLWRNKSDIVVRESKKKELLLITGVGAVAFGLASVGWYLLWRFGQSNAHISEEEFVARVTGQDISDR